MDDPPPLGTPDILSVEEYVQGKRGQWVEYTDLYTGAKSLISATVPSASPTSHYTDDVPSGFYGAQQNT